MECLNKFWIAPGTDQAKLVPCGKCFACKMNKRGDWVVRLSEQAKKSSGNYFVTLTYDEDHVPIGDDCLSLDRSVLSPFFKRLRKSMYGSHKGSLKYYAVGEYGTKTKRPHYHVLFLDTQLDKYSFRKHLDKSWVKINGVGNQFIQDNEKLGGIHVGDAKLGSIKYVAGYIINDFYKEDKMFQERPFSNMSKEIGLKYKSDQIVEWHKEDLLNRCYIPGSNGSKKRMPKYLKDKIYTKDEQEEINANYQGELFLESCKLSLDEHKIKRMEKEERQRISAARYFEYNKKAQV